MTEEQVHQLCSDVSAQLGQRADAQGLKSLTKAEQYFLLVRHAHGILGNGGFQYFFENDANLHEVADAFEAIGMAGTAGICREALKVFPNGKPIANREARLKWMGENEEQTLEWAGLMPALFLTEEWRDAEFFLAVYFSEHVKEFSVELAPSPKKPWWKLW